MYNKTAYDYNIITAKTLKNINTPSLWLSYFADSNYNAILWLKFCWQKKLDFYLQRAAAYTNSYISVISTPSLYLVRLRAITEHHVWHGRMKSPLGCSIFPYCSRYDFEYERFMLLSHQYIQRYCWSVVSPEDAARAQMLLELLFIRSGAFCLDSFSLSNVKVLIDGLRTC